MDILKYFAEYYPVWREPEPLARWRRLWFRLYAATMPIHHWDISSNAAQLFWYLRRTQWLSPESVERLQSQRLVRLMHYAYEHVPYYRDVMLHEGIRPEDFHIRHTLYEMPLLEKQTVRDAASNGLLCNDFRQRRPVLLTTSGSTGEPMEFYVGRFQLAMRWATTWRNFEWTGYQFGDRHVRLWHQTIGMKPVQIIKERLAAALCRRTFIPIFKLGDKTIEKFVKRIVRAHPVLLDGYAEALNLIALYLRSQALAGRGIPPSRLRGIISSAQTLSTRSRVAIEGAFGCGVYDKYGAREFSGIAHECVAHKMHVNAESYIVEILRNGRPARPGEMGEVVITDLNNYVMPFIRYRIGDLAMAVHNSSCVCGRGLPLIGAIEGRTQAIIIGTNGRYLSGTFFAHLFKDYSEVRRFQVMQKCRGHLTVRIIKADGFTRATMERLDKQLHAYLGADMKIDFRLVKDIPTGPTGKHYHSISRVKVDFNEGRVP